MDTKKDTGAEGDIPEDELELCHWTREQIDGLADRYAHMTQ